MFFVMPVPDQDRDDRSDIQNSKFLQRNWIPGQARNDYRDTSDTILYSTLICNTVLMCIRG